MNQEQLPVLADDAKICLINDSFPPIIDGVANVVYNYADLLTRFGRKVVVATPSYPHVKDEYPFPVLRYASLNTTRLVGYRAGYPFDSKTLQRLKSENCALIHTHCPMMSAYLARTLRELTDAPVVFTYHTKFDIDIANAIKFKLLQESTIKLLVNNIEACDEVWTVSRGAADNLRQLGYRGDIHLMENGVDLKKGRAPQDACDALRAQHGLSESETVFLFVGRMMWYKGIHIILDGLRAAAAQGAAFSMVFVGGGADEAEIRAEAERLGLMPRCRFVGPVRDRQLLARYYSMADLMLFPSTFDTNGIVVGEAAACGLPSVLVRGSCAAERICDGRNGILIDEDADDMAKVVCQACDAHERLRTIGQNAMDEIYISWEDSVKRAEARYAVVLNNYRLGKTSHQPVASDGMFFRIASFQELINWPRTLKNALTEGARQSSRAENAPAENSRQ